MMHVRARRHNTMELIGHVCILYMQQIYHDFETTRTEKKVKSKQCPQLSGSGFENSSGGGVWAQVGGPKLGPRGWAQVGGPRIHRFGPLGIEVEKQGFRTVRKITGQKFP